MVISFGLIQSFGMLQLPYEHHLNFSISTVARIGSIHIFFIYFPGTFSGWALDRGYYKRMLFVGSVLPIIGLLAANFSKIWWMTFLFHGVFQGIGHGLMFCPAVTTTAVYF
jgi:MFS family permease